MAVNEGSMAVNEGAVPVNKGPMTVNKGSMTVNEWAMAVNEGVVRFTARTEGPHGAYVWRNYNEIKKTPPSANI